MSSVSADYAISHVRRDPQTRSITTLYVWTMVRNTMTNPQTMSRASVINLINQGYTVYTVYSDGHGGWQWGARVRVYRNYYLRTDDNQIEADNLGNLPEF